MEIIINIMKYVVETVRQFCRYFYNNKYTNLYNNIEINDNLFWNKFVKSSTIYLVRDKIEYLLNEFGTKEPCNRFDIGNTIEYLLCDYIRDIGFEVQELPNAKRIDFSINNSYNLSIKYSSIGNITLHNSNSCINRDMHMTDFLLLTNKKIYLITNSLLIYNNVSINDYLINSGDSLKLDRKLLNVLERLQYKYILDFPINVDKSKCKNRLCSKVFYKQFNNEYNKFSLFR